MRTLRTLLSLLVAAVLAATLVTPSAAQASRGGGGHGFPDVIPLPNGWQPEGIATGRGATVYAGSLATGAVWRGDLRTGEGSVLVPPRDGRVAVGLKHSRGILYVAGGASGEAYLYDARSGATLDVLQLARAGSSPTFVNDVAVTRSAAWFTDSFRPVLYRVPLWQGRVAGPVRELPLTGAWTQVPDAFNANGIVATPGGRALLVINSTVGRLYKVHPWSGVAREVRTSQELTAGDGILLRGRTLAVVRNQVNEVVLLRLSKGYRKATLQRRITDPDFDVPTTVAAFGKRLYVVNARFGTPAGPDVTYDIVKVDGR
jgi:sugar lactone lactonase YvrE